MSTKDEQIVKVEGWVSHNYEGNGACAFCVRSYEGDRPALLLIAPEGSTQVPRVFSEGEVRAKEMEASASILREVAAVNAAGRVIADHIAAKHKIIL